MESARSAPTQPKAGLSPAQMEASRKLDALLLHRTRVLRDLQTCQGERYRATLTEGLKYLEAQLTELGWHN